MSKNNSTAFWCAIVCSNVWSAAGNPTMGIVWAVFAVVVFVAGWVATRGGA